MSNLHDLGRSIAGRRSFQHVPSAPFAPRSGFSSFQSNHQKKNYFVDDDGVQSFFRPHTSHGPLSGPVTHSGAQLLNMPNLNQVPASHFDISSRQQQHVYQSPNALRSLLNNPLVAGDVDSNAFKNAQRHSRPDASFGKSSSKYRRPDEGLDQKSALLLGRPPYNFQPGLKHGIRYEFSGMIRFRI